MTIDSTQAHLRSSKSERNLIIQHVNINKIKEEFKQFIHDTHTYNITIQETKLIPKAKTPNVHNFNTVRTDSWHKVEVGCCCCCLPTHLTPPVGGVRCGPQASLSLHPVSSSITTAVSAHKSSGDNVVYMWVQLKRWCVPCVWRLQMGHGGDGCVWCRFCVSMIRRRDMYMF